jgi:dTDP-4-dehydrorhamnose reductase/UDP-glucose 4-epimerase
MRIVLVGKGSFIARAIAHAARSRGVNWIALPHDAPLEDLKPSDCVINLSLHPKYRSTHYTPETDCDLQVAVAVQRTKARFIMLSTRRVYAPDSRWGAIEDKGATGDETSYGQNKARTEKAVMEALSGKAGIFRLSNIFGYEYDATLPRKSFFGLMLTSLKRENTIFFDMHPDTRRDFLPVELTAGLLLDRALECTEGIYNLGCGFALPCGDLANWVREGYGGGEIVCSPMTIRDEFFLNMNRWRGRFELPLDEGVLREYCIGLGRRLRCEKS